MKRVVAIIRQEKLEDVKNALIAIGCDGITISEVKGHGKQLRVRESYRGSNYCIDLIPKTRLETIIRKTDLKNVIETIQKTAKTGDIGDGKIFVSSVEEVIRIRTGETGENAI